MRAQWEQLIPLLREGGLVPCLDLACQGCGDDVEDDAFVVRVGALSAAGHLSEGPQLGTIMQQFVSAQGAGRLARYLGCTD